MELLFASSRLADRVSDIVGQIVVYKHTYDPITVLKTIVAPSKTLKQLDAGRRCGDVSVLFLVSMCILPHAFCFDLYIVSTAVLSY